MNLLVTHQWGGTGSAMPQLVIVTDSDSLREAAAFGYSSSQYALQSRAFAPFERERSALKPENSPPIAGCFQAGF